jgi:hypothetical protein
MNETLKTKIEIRPNTTVEVTYTHTGPSRIPPNAGAEWPASYDWAEVRVDLALPRGYGSCRRLAPYLAGVQIFGFNLGEANDAMRTASHTAPTVREAYDACRAAVDAAVESIAAVIDARNARNQQRCDTIARSRVGSPFHHVD